MLLVSMSCTQAFDTEQLEQAPVQDLDFERVFSDYQQFRRYLDKGYSYMPNNLSRLWNSLVAELSDECEGVGGDVCSPVFNNGAWSADDGNLSGTDFHARNELSLMWNNLFAGIRQANMVIAHIDKVKNFPSQDIYNRSLGEAYFLRAYLYFELVKRWGAVPLFNRPLELGVDDLDLPRASYDECIAFIEADCNTAFSLLKLVNDEADTGRATKGAALALKSRTLLYAARPLNNPTNDTEKWKAAAAAAWEVISLNQYSLDPDYANMFFRPDLGTEIIMNRPRTKLNFEQGRPGNNSSFFVRIALSGGNYNSWAVTGVTGSFVDLFEDSNGYPIIHPASNYTLTNPYANRDPRLKMTVLYNNRFWYNKNIEFYKKDNNGRQGEEYNKIGYSIAKFWPEAHQRYKGTSTYLNFIFFRYAEILLNYAEAVNEAYGPDVAYPGAGLTAREATNQVRQRVNHVPIPLDISSTTNDMRERIINERAIELCFEEHRWYDVISWNRGVEIFGASNPIKGMESTKNADGSFTYQPFVFETRTFKPYMHRYPIPNSEIFKSNVLEQNPGW